MNEADPPLVTIEAREGSETVTEGDTVEFTLTRGPPTEASLTVNLEVTESGIGDQHVGRVRSAGRGGVPGPDRRRRHCRCGPTMTMWPSPPEGSPPGCGREPSTGWDPLRLRAPG